MWVTRQRPKSVTHTLGLAMLTDTAIKKAQPRAKAYRLTDERGLHLLVQPNGSKLWRLKYRFDGKEKRLALGAYPAVSLQQARQSRTDARELLAQGADPSAEKKAAKQAQRADGVITVCGYVGTAPFMGVLTLAPKPVFDVTGVGSDDEKAALTTTFCQKAGIVLAAQ